MVRKVNNREGTVWLFIPIKMHGQQGSTSRRWISRLKSRLSQRTCRIPTFWLYLQPFSHKARYPLKRVQTIYYQREEGYRVVISKFPKKYFKTWLLTRHENRPFSDRSTSNVQNWKNFHFEAEWPWAWWDKFRVVHGIGLVSSVSAILFLTNKISQERSRNTGRNFVEVNAWT